MESIEQRLQRMDDQAALRGLLHRYITAVDSLTDIDGLVGCFTSDGVMDLSPIGLPSMVGHAPIRAFFDSVFADMTHHAHFVSNFDVERLEGDNAYCTAYVMGMGKNRAGNSVLVHVKYYLKCVRTPTDWKFAHFTESALMPLPDSLDEIHGNR